MDVEKDTFSKMDISEQVLNDSHYRIFEVDLSIWQMMLFKREEMDMVNLKVAIKFPTKILTNIYLNSIRKSFQMQISMVTSTHKLKS